MLSTRVLKKTSYIVYMTGQVCEIKEIVADKFVIGAVRNNKYGGEYQLLNYGGGDGLYFKLRGTCPFGIYTDNAHVAISQSDAEALSALDVHFQKLYPTWKPIVKSSEQYGPHVECSVQHTLFWDNSGKNVDQPLHEQTVGAEVSLLVHLANVSMGAYGATIKPRAKQIRLVKLDRFATKCMV